MNADTITLDRIQTIKTILEDSLFSVNEIFNDPPSPDFAAGVINDAITNIVNANQ
jgi:hypothetical protein